MKVGSNKPNLAGASIPSVLFGPFPLQALPEAEEETANVQSVSARRELLIILYQQFRVAIVLI